MDPVSAVALAGTIAALINSVAVQIMAIKRLHDQIKTADAHLMSFVSQLNSIKAALGQIQDLLASTDYDEQLQEDLQLSLQASELQMNYIEAKMAGLKTKNAAAGLRFRSKLRLVFESDGMEDCLVRLNHQATALNLLISVMTSKSLAEQKTMLQRSSSRKVFRQVREDQASLLDETASISVLRDDESVANALERQQSEPIIAKNPWKRFSFDNRVLGSKAYRPRINTRRATTQNDTIAEGNGISSEHNDDALVPMIVSEPDDTAVDITRLRIDLHVSITTHTPAKRLTKMLAFGQTEQDIAHLISHGKKLWDASEADPPPYSKRQVDSRRNHRLNTRYFDMTIKVHTLDEYHGHDVNEELLADYRDISSVLFMVNLSAYHYDERVLERDLQLFRRTANDYHLWLAKIILFLNTTDLEPYSVHSVSEDVKEKFMIAGKVGANDQRIHAVIGEVDEMTAGTVFAVSNEIGNRSQENKWAGLTPSPLP